MSQPDRTYTILPVKNTVLFPGLFLPLSVGRPASRAAIDAALATEDKTLVVVAQRDNELDAPGLADVFPVGTVAVIKKMARGPEGVEVLVQGGGRRRGDVDRGQDARRRRPAGQHAGRPRPG